MNASEAKNVLWLVLMSIGLSGCAMTATYGKQPVPDAMEKDKYSFTVYFNAYTTAHEVTQKAKREIKTFMEKSGYSEYEIVNVSSAYHLGKAIFEVKFWE